MKGKKGMSKPIYVGVDDGHYAIKVVTESGGMFTIPSRARSGRHLISWQEQEENGGFYQTEEGGAYTVNEHLQNYEDTRFKEYPKSALNRDLVHHALRQAGFGMLVQAQFRPLLVELALPGELALGELAGGDGALEA